MKAMLRQIFTSLCFLTYGVAGAVLPLGHHSSGRFITNGINYTDPQFDLARRSAIPKSGKNHSAVTGGIASSEKQVHDEGPHRAMIGVIRKRWPIKVPYTTAELRSPKGNKIVRDSIRDIEKKSCLTFVRRTIEVDYINFVDGEGCFSQIGKQGGKQDVILGEGCFTQPKTEHEILHTLGAYHEQNRPDRDKYVRIFFKNIQPKFKEQFIRRLKPKPFDKYDYGSIMHYGKWAFSKNGKPIMAPKLVNGRRYIGDFGVLNKHGGMTKYDARELNNYYACDRVNNKVALVDFEVRPRPARPGQG